MENPKPAFNVRWKEEKLLYRQVG